MTEKIVSIDGTEWAKADCKPFFVVFTDGNGERRHLQTYAPDARKSVDVALKLLELEHTEDGTLGDDEVGAFDPSEFEVEHIFPGFVESCVAFETMKGG